jgi:hypothetical protein
MIDMDKNEVTIKGIAEPQAVCTKIMKWTKRSAKVLSPLVVFCLFYKVMSMPPHQLCWVVSVGVENENGVLVENHQIYRMKPKTGV